jgi:hypothetical protein
LIFHLNKCALHDLKFFTVSLAGGGQAEAKLNAFLRGRKVLAVDRRWVEQGSDPAGRRQ